ncbi:hypothetical protein RB195_016269 [Necator americanus]
MENDQRIRERYRNRTTYAMNQVLERMLEVRCHDPELRVADKDYQIQHAKDALIWFLEYLNLTEVIVERTGDSPWTWLGSMFYAGQLYTTIGYGYPTTSTTAGRVASIFYILFGIPIFLIILKDIGRLMSKGSRKLYKRLRESRQKVAESKPIKLISQPFASMYRSKHTSAKNLNIEDVELALEQQNKVNAKLHAQNAFPIPIALAMLFLWILFSAGLFCLWEREWGYLTSVYFFFVSISTVGLGDIVFLNPDMMIFNFLLILIGLALLSMCFNLIQTALERLLDRLLEEYIEEIEKMAEIVAQDEYMEEEVGPLEFRMAGNLLALPMKKVTKQRGVLAGAKEWMAGRIANNMLATRLGPTMDSDSEEEEELQRLRDQETPALKISTVSTPRRRSGRRFSSTSSDALTIAESVRSSRPPTSLTRFKFRYGRSLFDTVRTLEKMKPNKGDFRSLLFSKFIQSDRLNRMVDDSATPAKRMVASACQTDEMPIRRRHHHHHRRREESSSYSSSSSSSTSRMVYDDESLISSAYCDLRFDYSTELAPSSRQHSSFSILKMEDEEPILPSSKFKQPIWFTPWKTPPKLYLQQLPYVSELPSPLNIVSSLKRYSSHSVLSYTPEIHAPNEELLEHIRSVCGLLPSDFDLRSNSSRSTMIDSGYDKSHYEDTQKPDQILPASPS